jgi:hypothetical protein
MEEPHLLPEVTKLNPWVSMATPVRWTCSSTYQLIKEDFPAEWFPEEGENYYDIWDPLKADKAEALSLYGDTGALDMLLHVPVDKGRFPRRMVP